MVGKKVGRFNKKIIIGTVKNEKHLHRLMMLNCHRPVSLFARPKKVRKRGIPCFAGFVLRAGHAAESGEQNKSVPNFCPFFAHFLLFPVTITRLIPDL